MAEGILRHLAGNEYEVFSAGTEPRGIHPRTVAVMSEIGSDISRQTSRNVQEFVERKFDYVITVCDRAKRQCPTFPGAVPIHWAFDDPAEVNEERQLKAFQTVRNEIMRRLRLFADTHRVA